MTIIPKYKIGTSIAVDRQKVLDYFYKFIYHKNENEKWETYTCKDNSILILQLSEEEDRVFAKFHCNIEVNVADKSISFPGISWFLTFCNDVGCEIQNLNTKVIMPSSGGTITSGIF